MVRRSTGEGTICQRKDGRWQASLQVNGARRTVYGKTRQEAYRKLAALPRQAAISGSLPDRGRRTLDDLVDYWLETVTPTLKPRTLADYRQTYHLYLRPTLGELHLDNLIPDSIQRVYNSLQTRGLRRAAAKCHAILHRALGLAVLWGWLAESAAERVVRPQYRPARKEVWTPGELQAFLAGARDHWLYPLWVVAIVSGGRVGELQALTWQDVDFDGGTIRISKALQRLDGRWMVTEPKTRSGRRAVALPPHGVEALRVQAAQQATWRARVGPEWNPSPLVFTQWHGSPLHEATVSQNLKRTCQRLGIPEVTPHGLRHLHASLLLHAGLPLPAVSARLGHAHPGITLSVYSHVVGDQADVAGAEAIGQALASGK